MYSLMPHVINSTLHIVHCHPATEDDSYCQNVFCENKALSFLNSPELLDYFNIAA